MRLGIFGGTFDPLHLGHLEVANEAVKSLNLDKLIFVVAKNPVHKKGNLITDEKIRVSMVKSILETNEKFEYSDVEINKGLVYSYETIQYFDKKFIDKKIFFITGSDGLMNIEKWKNCDIIFKKSGFVTFNRAGYSYEDLVIQKKYIEDKYNTKVKILDMQPMKISSSEIKEKIRKKEEYRHLVPDSVFKIIEINSLYR